MLHPDISLFSLIVILCAGSLVACAESGDNLRVSRHELAIGDRSVSIVVHDAPQSGLTLINLHEDETTSVEAGLEYIRRNGGRVIHLEHSGDRNIRFNLNDSSYTVDPNRIFTDTGIQNTLTSLSSYAPDAHEAVRAFSDSLLSIFSIDTLSAVVTLHNNTDENYSILSYSDGGAYETDALFTYVDRGKDIDDFFFITEPDWFSDFRSAGFNVVVQDNQQVTDDGSLSVLCGQRGIPYVNVEAQHGHFEIQLQMLDHLGRYFRKEGVMPAE